jgi:hypothetical protein
MNLEELKHTHLDKTRSIFVFFFLAVEDTMTTEKASAGSSLAPYLRASTFLASLAVHHTTEET